LFRTGTTYRIQRTRTSCCFPHDPDSAILGTAPPGITRLEPQSLSTLSGPIALTAPASRHLVTQEASLSLSTRAPPFFTRKQMKRSYAPASNESYSPRARRLPPDTVSTCHSPHRVASNPGRRRAHRNAWILANETREPHTDTSYNGTTARTAVTPPSKNKWNHFARCHFPIHASYLHLSPLRKMASRPPPPG
jgi:hypothetical protein